MSPRFVRLIAVAAIVVTPAHSQNAGVPTNVAAHHEDRARLVTADDIIRLRLVESLVVSPDGSKFAIFVRQANVAKNTFETGWYVGRTEGGALTFVGDGGEAQPYVFPDGDTSGEIGHGTAKWSPDSRWIAYVATEKGEAQVWRSRADGQERFQVTHAEADVRDFEWGRQSDVILYSTGRSSRTQIAAAEEKAAREGYPLNAFHFFPEIVHPGKPLRALDQNLVVWAASPMGERAANPAERVEWEQLQHQRSGGRFLTGTELSYDLSSASRPAIENDVGARAWFAPDSGRDSGLIPQVTLKVSTRSGQIFSCHDPACSGQNFVKAWWIKNEVVFWRKTGVSNNDDGIYRWTPGRPQATMALNLRDTKLTDCDAVEDHLVCLSETPSSPRRVVAFDLTSGKQRTLADLNPEFHAIRLGRWERIEWDVPEDVHKIGYPKRARAYVFYPPDFDPSKKYPLFVAPYFTGGFPIGDVGNEHPLLAYAAAGMIVLNSEFPLSTEGLATETMAQNEARDYSAENGFPHLQIMAESTFRAINVLVSRGYIDQGRIGIGGVSHGSFIPLYMMQTRDVFAAASISSGSYTILEPYLATSSGRELKKQIVGGDWMPLSQSYWSKIDIADHVDTIEAPLLLNFSSREAVLGLPRLVRMLDEHNLPYDAYVYPDEWHIKTQPAHTWSIYNRNLDWFRFWLEDREDPSPTKANQYVQWRQLRNLQCANPRSVRNYCQNH